MHCVQKKNEKYFFFVNFIIARHICIFSKYCLTYSIKGKKGKGGGLIYYNIHSYIYIYFFFFLKSKL